MKKVLYSFVCMLLCACLCIASATAETPVTVTVQGSASVTARPDTLCITASVSISRSTAAQAQSDVADVIAAVHSGLEAYGLSEDDVVTQSYYFYPAYNYEEIEPVLTGYTVTHTLTITCGDVSLLDSLLGTLTECGISQVDNISFDVAQRSELYNQALAAALEQARLKAESLAAAAGLTMLTLESVQEQTTGGMVMYRAGSAAAKDAVPSGIHTGNVEVSAGVTVTYLAR